MCVYRICLSSQVQNSKKQKTKRTKCKIKEFYLHEQHTTFDRLMKTNVFLKEPKRKNQVSWPSANSFFIIIIISVRTRILECKNQKKITKKKIVKPPIVQWIQSEKKNGIVSLSLWFITFSKKKKTTKNKSVKMCTIHECFSPVCFDCTCFCFILIFIIQTRTCVLYLTLYE